MLAAAVLLQPGNLLASPASAGSSAQITVAPSGSAATRGSPEPGKPGECKSNADCGAGFACFSGGRCLCKPGRRLCETTCANLQTDAQDCGVCGHACAAGDTCIEGACRASGAISPLKISPLSTVSSPFRISAYDGTTYCQYISEAAPERAAVAGTARFFVAHNFDYNNWADSYDSWGTVLRATPDAPNTTVTGGDPSATTSDFTGLDYIGYISKRSGDAGNCFGIAVANSDGIATNTFAYDHGVECTAPNTDGSGLDAPTMTYDLGGTDLWAAYRRGSQHVVQIMEDCRPGQPGCCTNDGSACTSTCSRTSTEQCPVTYNQAVVSNVRGQPTLAVNPCTHNGIMAYAYTDPTTQNKEIRINVRHPDGTYVDDVKIAGSKPHDVNDVCCNGEVRTCSDDGGSHYCDSDICSGEPCRRLPEKPEVVISEVSGTCYMYIAYDTSYTSTTDGHTYFTVRMGVWDVTDDSNPVWKKGWYTAGGSTTYNDYGHEVAAAGPYVALGFYTDRSGPCSTYFVGAFDQNSALSSLSYWGDLSYSFPNMRIYGAPSDWVRGISRGVGPGGQLLLTWEQPVCMNTGYSCNTCNIASCASGQWSHAEKGVVITP